MAQGIQYTDEMQRYLGYIAQYDKTFSKWSSRTSSIEKRYRDDAKEYRYDSETARFNILWSNVQTLVPATYSRVPQPDVSRRFRDSDPVGRVAALVLERALDFDLKHYPDFREAMSNSVLDRFLGGRGVSWVRYEPKISLQPPDDVPDDEEDPAPTGDGASDTTSTQAGADSQDPGPANGDDPDPLEQLDDECCPLDYVHWRDFGHSVARTWAEVSIVWRKVYMTRAELVKRFGEKIGNAIPLNVDPTDNDPKTRTQKNTGGIGSSNKQALLYEIWDKPKQVAVWLSKEMGDIVDVQDDPAGLEGFFPCPRPLFATLTNDTLVPVPDFTQYQDQANQLDVLSDRIDGLIKALKIRGCYNASFPVLQRLFTETGNTDLIPVKDWTAFADKMGLKGAIDIIDLTPIVGALQAAFQARTELIDQIYSLTGISDIMRGETEAIETAKAQGLKAQFGALRLRTTQREVAEYATALIHLKSQIICNKFRLSTILHMADAEQLLPDDIQVLPQAMSLLVGRMIDPAEWQETLGELQKKPKKVMRCFRIEVAADSLVELDEEAEKQSRVEFLTTMSSFLDKAVPAAQSVPAMAPLLLEMAKFGVSAFKAGKTLEGMFDNTLQQLQQQLKQSAGQPKPPPPEVQAKQIEVQARAQEIQAKGQIDLQIEQSRQQFEREKLSQEGQLEMLRAHLDQQTALREQQFQSMQAEAQNRMEAQRDLLQTHMQEQTQRQQQAFDVAMEQMKQFMAVEIARIGAASRIEVAEITTGAQLEAAQISAANQAEAPNGDAQ